MTTALWSRAAFLDAIEGTPSAIDENVLGISIDSRTVAPGDAFFAIEGDRFDGHDFVEQALAAGASCAVVSRPVGEGRKQLVVPDVLEALRELAHAARARTDAVVVGVTGSVGKTSTKEMLRAIFARAGKVHAANASFNNHWGVPLTLARMPADTDYAVCEIGMNHAGEITPLTLMVRPDIAIVTTVEAVHIEFFESVAAIADAKAEIFEGLERGGVAILNVDNPYFDRLSKAAAKRGARIVGFGRDPRATTRLDAVEPTPLGLSMGITLHGASYQATLGLRGDHMAMNALAALAAAEAAGVDVETACEGLASVTPAPGRGVRQHVAVEGGRILLIDESYNANPSSVAAALRVLGAERPRRVAVLGDMLELGAAGETLHRNLSGEIAGHADRAYLCGPLMRSLHDTLGDRSVWAADSAALTPLLLADLAPGDTVMVKGSLGSRMGPVADAIRALARA